MPDVAPQLPLRRPGLVCWRAAENGRWLVRNRQSGESFRLGEEEHFLLERLDDGRTAEDLCRTFAEQFGKPLSAEELDEFVQLAAGRGLLQHDDDREEPTRWSDLNASDLRLPPPTARRPMWNRIGSRLLKAVSTGLQWPIRLLGAAAGRLDMFRLAHLDFTPRPDDVFIVTYPRSGTTWMQMFLYQLTGDGKMDFPHIAEYCPWFERSIRSATAFETRPSPRLFKSHLPYKEIPKGPCKYIYVARDGKDVAVSYYHLDRMYNGFDGTFAQFFDRFLKGKTLFGSWFEHVKGWWEHRDDADVLYLTYEELTRDLAGCIRRIAAFIGRDVPAERIPGILEGCRFDFMKQHESQFDPVMESLWEQGVRLKSFLRNGRVGDGSVTLTEEQQARFDEAFNKRLKPLRIPLS